MERTSKIIQEVAYQVTGSVPPTVSQSPVSSSPPQLRTIRNYFAEPAACPTCGAPPGIPGYLRADVPTGHEDFGKVLPCSTCHGSKLSSHLREISQLDGWLEQANFDNFKLCNANQGAYDAALKFAAQPVGWLTLWGTFGPGKTHLLASIANKLTAEGMTAIYYTLPDLMDALRNSYKDDFSGTFHRVANVPVLLIDEVDKINPTLWAMEKAYQLFDARYRALSKFGTVFAMNTRPEIADDDTDYIFSRMLDRRFTVVEVGGGDMRPVLK